MATQGFSSQRIETTRLKTMGIGDLLYLVLEEVDASSVKQELRARLKRIHNTVVDSGV